MLVDSKSDIVKSSLAANPSTPDVLLDRLSADKEWNVRCCVAENPSTPAAVLGLLVADTNSLVRGPAAGNPSAFIFFDNIMQQKTIKTGVFRGFLSNPNVIPKLEPYFPDFLRLLEGKEPITG